MIRGGKGKLPYINNITPRRLSVNGKRYQWPNPFETDEQAQKFTGADIGSMTDMERWLEIKRLESLLPWLDKNKILIIDLSRYPATVITRQTWALERMKRLKSCPPDAGIGKFLKTVSR
jgi:hypothetical protein